VQYGLQPPRTWLELLAVARTFYEKEQIGCVLFTGAGGARLTSPIRDRGHLSFFSRPTLVPVLRVTPCQVEHDQSDRGLGGRWPKAGLLACPSWSRSGKTASRTCSGWAGPVREAHVIGGDVLGIPVGAPHYQLALALIRHLQSWEVQAIFANRLNRGEVWDSVGQAW
jgi:trehalose transport system substrate-binding protein